MAIHQILAGTALLPLTLPEVTVVQLHGGSAHTNDPILLVHLLLMLQNSQLVVPAAVAAVAVPARAARLVGFLSRREPNFQELLDALEEVVAALRPPVD